MSDSSSRNRKLSISEVNEMGPDGFVSAFGHVFEHSPWVAERAWASSPFTDRSEILETMTHALNKAGRERQLELMHAHPHLAGKSARAGQLTQDSSTEQTSAGLDTCSPDELAILRKLNSGYIDKFGFPFIMAVKGLDRETIMNSIEARLQNTRQQEFQTNLEQIARIADLRLKELIDD